MFIRHPFTLTNPGPHFDEKVENLTDAQIEQKVIEDVNKQLDKKEEKQEAKNSDDGEIKESSDDTSQDAEAEKAAQIYELLKDPQSAAAFVKALAPSLGIKLADIDSKEDKKEAVKSIKDLVKEELGTDYAFLGDKLGNVLEKVINTSVESRTKELEKQFNEEKITRERREIENAMDSVFDSYANISTELKNSVYQLVDDFPPKKGSDPVKYFERLVTIAAQDNKVSLIKRNAKNEPNNERRDKNRNDAQNRLRAGDTADEKTASAGSDVNSITEAIRKGMAEADKLLAGR